MVGFGGLQGLSDGRFCSGNEISMMVGLKDLKDGMFSVSVVFFRYEFSTTVGFAVL